MRTFMRKKWAVVNSRIDTAELHRVYENMLQRAQKCIDVQEEWGGEMCALSKCTHLTTRLPSITTTLNRTENHRQ
jgi:hypothetical protein